PRQTPRRATDDSGGRPGPWPALRHVHKGALGRQTRRLNPPRLKRRPRREAPFQAGLCRGTVAQSPIAIMPPEFFLPALSSLESLRYAVGMKLRLSFPLSLFLTISILAQNPARPASGAPRSLPRVSSQTEFDKLARVYYQGRFYALPHLMFIIDRAAKDLSKNKIYYVNSKQYSFNSEFASANYLTRERGREFFRRNYLEANRRFILGTIAYQTKISKFTFEFWEGDLATAEILSEAYKVISASFFAPVYFKPNSAHQEEVS